MDKPERHPELSRVALARDVASPDGTLPAGATGTVVHVYLATVEASFVGE